MRILLPPSEAKACGGRGRPLGARVETGPLAEPRAAVLAALHVLIDGGPAAATRALLLPSGVTREALTANTAVTECRTTPALRRYSGVVYDGLGYDPLSPRARGSPFGAP